MRQITAVVGTAVPKQEFEENVDVSHPKIISGMSNDLSAFDNGNDKIVIGVVVYQYNGYEKQNAVKDLMSEYASERVKAEEQLEEFGIENRASIYLISETE